MELVQRKQAMIKGQSNRQNMQRQVQGQEKQVGEGEKLNAKQLDQVQQKSSRKQVRKQFNKQPKVKQQKVKPLPVPKMLSNIRQDSSPIQLQLQLPTQPTQVQLPPPQQEILLIKDTNLVLLQTQNETSISQSQLSLNNSKKTFCLLMLDILKKLQRLEILLLII